MRQDRVDRRGGPRRKPGHLRELLPAACRALRCLRQSPALHLRRQRPPSPAGNVPLGPPPHAPAAARCARRRRAGPTARSATGVTALHCATGGACASCAQVRRPVDPPGLAADTCAACAGLPVTHACGDCGIEDKLFEKGRCARCSLRWRAAALLSGGTGQVPGDLAGVFEAVCSARTPRAALNWLRTGAGAAILADLAAVPLARDPPGPRSASPAAGGCQPSAAGTQMLITGGVLAPRYQGNWPRRAAAGHPGGLHRAARAPAARARLRHLGRDAAAAPHRRRQQPPADLHRARPAQDQGRGPGPWPGSAPAEPRSRPGRQADVDYLLATGPGACYIRGFLAGQPPKGTAPRSRSVLRTPGRNCHRARAAPGTGRPAAPRRQPPGHRPRRLSARSCYSART